MTAKEQLIKEIEQATDELVEEVLDFFLFKKTRQNGKASEPLDNSVEEASSPESQPQQGDKPIWELFEDFTKDIPEEVLAKLPKDGAEQHDHYIYGTPKRQQ